ncbi:MAG: hypothetical protein QMD65_01015 [Patescibacteria group bacterium]|nr:hypothetical protein [Patescibacteria group bacterium]
MNRTVKQIIYGTFFALVFIFLIFGLSQFFSEKEKIPTCFDGIKNQREKDIDCGGPCISCEIIKLKSIESSSPIKILHLSNGRLALLAKILNPNETYGTDRFFYNFKLYDGDSNLLETLSGGDNIYPAETKYLYVVPLEASFIKLKRVEVEFSKAQDIEWRASHLFLRSNLNDPISVSTKIIDGRIHVGGIIKNSSSIGAEEVKIIALIFDKFDDDLFAMQTVLNNLEAFSEKTFNIIFPADIRLINNVDLKSTKLFISSR